MAYCSLTDIEARLGAKNVVGLSNDTPNATTPDAALVSTLIARADGVIDAQVRQVYDVPLSPVPEVIKSISVDLASFFLLQRRFSETEMPSDWQQAYKDAVDLLKDIADMKVALVGVSQIRSPEAEIVAPPPAMDFRDRSRQESFY
jgi:phage gp36-like protein